MKPRKKTCKRCGRKLWISRDFYANHACCKDCESEKNREHYNKTRKVKDGIRYDAAKGKCIEHNGYSTRYHWSDAMIEKLTRIFPTTKNEDCAIEFDMSVRTIIRKARELGLEKNKAWFVNHCRKNCEIMRIYNKCRGNGGMFKKGQHPSPATEFKPKKQRLYEK